MNTFETACVIFLAIWLILSIANIPLTIWETKLKTNKQSENNSCIYALYKEMKRYNDSNSEKN